MTLNKKIELAQAIQSNIGNHVASLWPGFSPVPFILYDAENQVAVGSSWPERYRREQDGIWIAEGTDPVLMGNTSIMYHGNCVAIWDTRTWEEPDVPRATSCLAHEMFHAFQNLHMELPYANELLMPSYPHSPKSVALALEEGNLFTKMMTMHVSTEEICACLTTIALLRKLRKKEIGAEYMEYDEHMEGIEGTAAYIEIMMPS